MKKLIAILIVLIATAIALEVAAQNRNRWASARYQPVAGYLEADATLSTWYRQYIDTTAGGMSFEAFLKKLSTSEVLWQRSNRAGIRHKQLYSPIVKLLEVNWQDAEKMNADERESVRLAMLELDIALAAVDATLPKTAHEEFRREVFRGAKPLTEVAKLPMPAVEAMTFTIMNHKVSERINEAPKKKVPPSNRPDVKNPRLNSEYYPW